MRPRRRRLRIRHDDLDAVQHLRIVLLRQRILIPERSFPGHPRRTAAAIGAAVIRPRMRAAGDDDMDGFFCIGGERGRSAVGGRRFPCQPVGRDRIEGEGPAPCSGESSYLLSCGAVCQRAWTFDLEPATLAVVLDLHHLLERGSVDPRDQRLRDGA